MQDGHKKLALSIAARDARAFRTRLRKSLFDEDGNLMPHPPEKYQRLASVADYWTEFAKQSSTEEFKVILLIYYTNICSSVSFFRVSL